MSVENEDVKRIAEIIRKSVEIFQKIHLGLIDTLFPLSCVSCGSENSWICTDCLKNIQLLSYQVCPSCEKIITDRGKLCKTCHNKGAPLDALIVATKYSEAPISKLVHLLKYNFAASIAPTLSEILLSALIRNDQRLPDLIVPIPLHPRRLRWRGFNQAQLLSEHIATGLAPGFSIPIISDLITRERYTRPQMKIGKFSGRRKNVSGAFKIKKSADLSGKIFLLIDDVATTGATISECARILKEKGARKVYGAVIARQDFSI